MMKTQQTRSMFKNHLWFENINNNNNNSEQTHNRLMVKQMLIIILSNVILAFDSKIQCKKCTWIIAAFNEHKQLRYKSCQNARTFEIESEKLCTFQWHRTRFKRSNYSVWYVWKKKLSRKKTLQLRWQWIQPIQSAAYDFKGFIAKVNGFDASNSAEITVIKQNHLHQNGSRFYFGFGAVVFFSLLSFCSSVFFVFDRTVYDAIAVTNCWRESIAAHCLI